MELEEWISGMELPAEIAGISRVVVENWEAAGCPDNLEGFLDERGYTVREVRFAALSALENYGARYRRYRNKSGTNESLSA